MAKKKKKRTTKKKRQGNQAIWLIVLLIIIGLSAWGIDFPQQLQDFFFDEEITDIASIETEIVQDNSLPQEERKTSFTEADLLDNGSAWIEYHELDALGRPTGADGLLKKEIIGTGTSAKQSIRPPGFISGLAPHFHARGHLIGRQLGGSGDDPRNLVTLYQTPVNTPYMTKYENMVRKAVDEGQTVRYRVTPIYEGDELMCSYVEMEGQSVGPNADPDILFTVTIKNAQKENNE